MAEYEERIKHGGGNVGNNQSRERREYFKEKAKEYYENHKEEVKLRDIARYEIKKEEILKKQAKNCVCERGFKYTHGHKAQHPRTQKHQNYLQQ